MIIGIVAAMTIPLISARYHKHIVEVRLKKFYSTMNQAIRKSEIDNGDKRFWEPLTQGFEEDEDGNPIPGKVKQQGWYDKYIAPYIIATKTEVDTAGKILTYFPDGSMCMWGGNSIIFYPSVKDYSGAVKDENGEITSSRDQTVCGKKYFTFNFSPSSTAAWNKYHYNKGVEPYVAHWDGTREMLINHSSLGCRKEGVSNERAYCTMLIMMNNWTIPDDYPLSF